MNSSITFSDIGLFNSAVSALELESVPEYDVEDNTLTVHAEDIDAIIDVLHDSQIYSFICHRGDDGEHDQFRNDAEADADALASAGMGTDEDYGYYGGDYDE
jgi:hypothetical protein